MCLAVVLLERFHRRTVASGVAEAGEIRQLHGEHGGILAIVSLDNKIDYVRTKKPCQCKVCESSHPDDPFEPFNDLIVGLVGSQLVVH
jgi:hypothetical protein